MRCFLGPAIKLRTEIAPFPCLDTDYTYLTVASMTGNGANGSLEQQLAVLKHYAIQDVLGKYVK